MARQARRQHVARRLEERFAPLFRIATMRLPTGPRDDAEFAMIWDAAAELDQLLERAGFRWVAAPRPERREWKRNLYRRNCWLAARWELPENPRTTDVAKEWEASEDPMTKLKPAAAQLAWLITIVGDLHVGFRADYSASVSLLEALATMDRRRRRDFLRWIQARPFYKATFAVDGNRVELRPHPRDLQTCIWLLAAELVAGGWPVRQCAAPKCGRYIGQWTKRPRRFCDEGCRTAYHNAARTVQGDGGKSGPPGRVLTVC